MLNDKYWENRYIDNNAPWDIGYASPPIVQYIDQLENKNLKILIPGCGNCYEAEYLWKKGFQNVHLLDFALPPLTNFQKQNPDFPADHLHHEDFFQHKNQYDLIIEQTFFCAIDRNLRQAYAKHMYSLLNENGKLAGVLFNGEFDKEGPPFGGNAKEYTACFEPWFNFKIFTNAVNSIPQREGREFFILFQKRLTSP